MRWKSTGLWSTWEDKFCFLLPYCVTCVRSAMTKAIHLICLLSQQRIFGGPADNFQLHILCAEPYLRFKKREREVPRKEPIHYISQKLALWSEVWNPLRWESWGYLRNKATENVTPVFTHCFKRGCRLCAWSLGWCEILKCDSSPQNT